MNHDHRINYIHDQTYDEIYLDTISDEEIEDENLDYFESIYGPGITNHPHLM